MIASAYIVHEPEEYWRQKEEMIRAMHEEWREAQIYEEIDRLRDELTKRIADVMAGKRMQVNSSLVWTLWIRTETCNHGKSSQSK